MVVAVALALVLAACGADEPDGRAGDGGEQSAGAEIYVDSCAACHGADGSGGQGPPLGDGVAAESLTEEEMVEVVTGGRDAMPSFAGDLTAEEIDQVVAYVRNDLTSTEDAEVEVGEGPRGDLEGLPPELAAASDDGDWAVANGDLLSQRAQVDSAITSDTVDDLELQWAYDVPGEAQFGTLTTTPLVSGDTVYVGDLTTKVHAVDRATGEQRFVVGDDAAIFGPTGVGLGYGQLYGTKGNDSGRGSVLVAYDAVTGEEAWAVDLGANGSDINVQPSAFGGLVFASTGGYGAGTRATIYAVDAETGTVVWDFPVIEDPDLWGHPELNSGGGVWYPPAIDAERGIAYFGTGNPYPFPGAEGFPNGSSRPGDNRWTDSMLALDIETGELVWGHQAIAHDIFDRDAMVAARVDVELDGEERALAISTGKLGVVHALDAETGEPLWETEVGIHENDELTEIDGPTRVYPGSLGGVQTPIAIADGTIYACVMNAPTQYAGPDETSFGFTVQLGTEDSQMVAIDAATGEVEWDVDLPGDALGGATVAGDLLFTSTFAGEVLALDRATGETVWTYQAPGGINGWPAVAGDQLFVPVGMGETPQLLAFGLPDA
ncbi:PQQ-binding-like beta-propeller repeat protein [Iamia majanohamensis]|uniref:PQQ-binding-like beta-propeller repeat protein n=1 Tax=Iamia majanohamensis TaxID=467976 RepID=A0AAF0BVK4_9ACTN|nr:PQQ-binding-like beta-propeller repeat protein [Iamia majanohamensis]WCO68947.1 PQQ-binding-like beta-propeller repeat protein [Iamia majanohamensis]